MAKNTIQFQKGLSFQSFLTQYGSESQCEQALYHLRWPKGFVCPHCGNTTGCALHSRKIYQCHKCHHQTSLTAGTIFHGTKLALSQWFLAIFLLTQRKQSVSAMQLSRDLGVKYDTAWRMKHKLMQVMLERNSRGTLAGRVEIDDASIWAVRCPASVAAGQITRSLSSPPLRRRRTVGPSVFTCVVSAAFGSAISRATPVTA